MSGMTNEWRNLTPEALASVVTTYLLDEGYGVGSGKARFDADGGMVFEDWSVHAPPGKDARGVPALMHDIASVMCAGLPLPDAESIAEVAAVARELMDIQHRGAAAMAAHYARELAK